MENCLFHQGQEIASQHPELQFPSDEDSPFQDPRTLAPPGVHFFGSSTDYQPPFLERFKLWVPIEISLAGIGVWRPFFVRTSNLQPIGTALHAAITPLDEPRPIPPH